MITINNVKYGKVDGSLTLNLQELTEEEKKRVIPYARVLPALSFKPDTEGSATVYLPFITIAKAQVSVQGSKAILAKIDVLPEYTSAVPPLPALPASSIFRFTGSEAEKNREAFTKALPKFPFPSDSPPLTNTSSSQLSPVKSALSSISTANTASPDKGNDKTTPSKSPPPKRSGTPSNPDKALEDSVLSSTTQNRQLRERRIALLRRDEKLRSAYHDLVISPPHIFTDEDFWNNYAWDSPTESDLIATDQPNASANSTATSTSTSTATSSAAAAAAIMLDEEEAQKSIETEIQDFSGFFELLSRSLVDDRLKLSLTPALRKQIYEEFPMVRVAFDAKVPSTMSAAEFWNTFFKAQLAKLMRLKEEKKAKSVKETRKKAKKTTAKPPPEPAPAPVKRMSEEEKQLAFFEKLTDATPLQLEKLVWQSRASDAVSKDPSQNKVSQRGSLISVLAEDDAVSSGRNAENALLLSRSLNAAHISAPANKSTFITDSAMDEDNNGIEEEEKPENPKSKKTAQESFLVQQQDALKHRISLISRGVSSSPSVGGKDSKDGKSQNPSNSGDAAAGMITAEEMLFSALQDQAAHEAGTSRTKVSAGQQSVLDAWQASAAKDGGIELLDGIMVEEGELDDETWSELKKEKERRSRHLQLIRKFNRHGHIVVSSSSNDDEVETRPEPKKTGETHQKYVFLSQKVDSGYHDQKQPTPFGADVATSSIMDVDSMDATNLAEESAMDFGDATGAHSTAKRSNGSPVKGSANNGKLVKIKREDGELEVHTTSMDEVFSMWPQLPRAAEAKPRPIPSLSDISKVMQQMSEWTPSLLRLKRPALTSPHVPSDTNSAMDYDLSGVHSMLERVNQWRRHFWNIMDRAGASSNRSTKFDFSGSEKLGPIVSQLSSLLGSIAEMDNFLHSVLDQAQGMKNPHISSAILKLQKEQMAVHRCIDLYNQLQTS